MNEKDEKRISWTDFKKSIVNQVSKTGNVLAITYRGKPQLRITAWASPSQLIALRHVQWKRARGFDLWTWRNYTPCIITMGQRKTPVAVVERWNEKNHTPDV